VTAANTHCKQHESFRTCSLSVATSAGEELPSEDVLIEAGLVGEAAAEASLSVSETAPDDTGPRLCESAEAVGMQGDEGAAEVVGGEAVPDRLILAAAKGGEGGLQLTPGSFVNWGSTVASCTSQVLGYDFRETAMLIRT
jgi:hypothetical protein